MKVFYPYNVDDYLSQSATNFPDKVAIVDHGGQRTTTFAQLNDLAKRLGSFLASKNLERQPILLILPKSMEALACFAGVTKSNNFYTIFDENAPIERLLKVIKIFAPKLIITRQNYKQLSQLKEQVVVQAQQNSASDNMAFSNSTTDISATSNITTDNLATSNSSAIPFLCVEELPQLSINESLLAKVRASHIDTDLLYVLFTSGSTGEPKGVTISHRSVIDYTEWLSKEFGFSENTNFLNQAPFYFDNSITDIYSTFKAGSALHLIDSMWFAFPAKVLKYMDEHQINTIFWVPSVLCFFANTAAVERFAPQLSKLQHVIFCGEPMPNKQLNIWRRSLPQCTFTNLYGPTEITDVCAYYRVERTFEDDEILPIGFACANTQLLVFAEEQDAQQQKHYRLITPDMPNEKGLLFVRGSSLSLGYYANHSKTNEVFIQSPLHSNYLDRVYNTGDIVAYNEYGELVCYGRADSQIKYQGHRIELGEIEAIINGHPEVASCACVFVQRIGLFYVAKQDLDLQGYLKDKLPPYMIPSHIERMDKFKLNVNGKIDRLVLKARMQELLQS